MAAHPQQAQANGKRKRVDVDLTADDDTDDDSGAPLKDRKVGQANARRNNGVGSMPTPPPSSATLRDPNAATPSTRSSHSVRERSAWLAHDHDDVNEIVGSSQDDAEGSDQLHLYSELSTKIVGVRYYNGYANPGEQIMIRREPGNPYDSNAIRIDNVSARQIGHIPRAMASKLARYLDNRWVHIEGHLAGGIGHFDCPLTLVLYGPDPNSTEGKQLQDRMAADKLPTRALKEAERKRKAAEKERLDAARKAAAAAKKNPQFASQAVGAGSSKQVDMADLLEASERINPREVSSAAEKLGFSESDLQAMPMAPAPDGIKTTMLPYQLQALQWLLDQETPEAPGSRPEESVQLWTKAGNGRFTNLATNHSVGEAPRLASGGILADDMGLGKTLEMISLIVADAEKYGRGPTLIVAPLSVMSNWSGQIEAHVKDSRRLGVYTYHAGGRVKMGAGEFQKYDVVITTYQTLASDYLPTGSKPPDRKLRATGLYSVEWRRVILDEGHTVRTPQSKGAAAVTALLARSRWVLTGTPIVNSLRDLYSLLRFIGVTGGLEQLDIFNRVLVRPMKQGDDGAQVLLKLIMRAFTLRRRKDMAFIDLKLPKLDEYVHRIDFTAKERERYDALAAEAKGQLASYENKANRRAQGAGQAFQHVLEMVLRMRQCCNHWQLCGERVTNLLAQLETQKTVDLTPENQKALQDMLQVQIESQEDCAICLETLHNPVITTCGHYFGRECIAKVIETQHKCPMCRVELLDERVLVQPTNECGDEGADEEMDLHQPSSKLEGLMQILGATKKGEKTVVFSQWTRYLDIVQARLEEEGYTFCRLDGTMNAKARDESLHRLEHDSTTSILLASLGVCAVGLNLTAANNVILCDTWWAPAIEDQAVDRVHRLGQKKETRVFRLVMDKSIEEMTLDIQQTKRQLMQLAFSEKCSKRDGARSGRLADIQRLLA